jgi:outer membrane protein OmpA-like peptidoglycan-associated protein
MNFKSKLPAATAALVGFAFALSALSGCAMPERRWDGCAIGGAVVGGAAGFGIGLGIANAVGRHGDNAFNEERGTAAWASALGGAALGTLAGHYLCDPVVEHPAPPPPPPPPVVEAPPPPPPPPPPPAPKKKIVLRGVHFDFDKSKIRPDAEPILDEAADILKQNPAVTVAVNGHCDGVGTEEYNMKLSRRRAAAVAKYLEAKDIPANRLETHGFGKTQPVASNDTAEGRAENRRVELLPNE